VDLDQIAGEMPYVGECLSVDEQIRADRFHFEKDRRRWRTARGLLRLLLGCCLDTDPATLRLTQGKYGKPCLAEGSLLRFNLSHSGGCALFTVAAGREVGVDVERIREDIDAEDLGCAVLSPRERQMLQAAAPEERNALFFAFWTAKEAYIKARGLGFSYPVQRLTVSLGDRSDDILTRAEVAEEIGLRPLSLRRLCGIEGHKAALAAEGSGWSLRFHRLAP
jgi:4'-phosphopantetheinyl transferase